MCWKIKANNTSHSDVFSVAPSLQSRTRWNSVKHLETEENVQLYLEACIEEAGDDPAFIVHALNVIARAKNMSQLARDTGLS